MTFFGRQAGNGKCSYIYYYSTMSTCTVYVYLYADTLSTAIDNQYQLNMIISLIDIDNQYQSIRSQKRPSSIVSILIN